MCLLIKKLASKQSNQGCWSLMLFIQFTTLGIKYFLADQQAFIRMFALVTETLWHHFYYNNMLLRRDWYSPHVSKELNCHHATTWHRSVFLGALYFCLGNWSWTWGSTHSQAHHALWTYCMCTFLCHLDVMDSVCVLHGCHLARISWWICAVQRLFEENGKGGMLMEQEREKKGKAWVWKADQEAGVLHFSSPAAGTSNACLWWFNVCRKAVVSACANM